MAVSKEDSEEIRKITVKLAEFALTLTGSELEDLRDALQHLAVIGAGNRYS